MDLSLGVADREAAFRSIPDRSECLPPLPFSLLKILDIIRDENTSESDIEEVVRHDEALSAKVLQIANSAYYGMRGSVCTLSRAIMTMGVREVKSLCLCFLILNQLPKGPAELSRQRVSLWKHSLTTALLSSKICVQRPWINTEKAFALGLLHDLGLLVLMSHLPECFERIRSISELNRVGFLEAEAQYGLTHSQVGGWLAVKWGLPDDYRLVMKYHHQPGCSPSLLPIVKLIHLADLLSRHTPKSGVASRAEVADICVDLVIGDQEFQHLCGSLDAIRQDVDRLWGLLVA